MSDELVRRLDQMAAQHFAGNVAHRRLVGTTLDAASARICELKADRDSYRETSNKLATRVANAEALLEECEMLISGLECRCDGMNRCARCVTLDKLRGTNV